MSGLPEQRIEVTEDGPYLVYGSVPLVRVTIVGNEAGESVGIEEIERYPLKRSYALCRCGSSASAPYCDGSHGAMGFEGEEIAARDGYLKDARTFEGDGILLKDQRDLCMGAAFCKRGDGVWSLTLESTEPEKKALAIEEAELCPGGRLQMVDVLTGEPYEPDLEPSIALIEDGRCNISSAIWVRGGLPVFGADGQPYEIRNRLTLCRCGKSANKPLCDAAHYGETYDDGLTKR